MSLSDPSITGCWSPGKPSRPSSPTPWWTATWHRPEAPCRSGQRAAARALPAVCPQVSVCPGTERPKGGAAVRTWGPSGAGAALRRAQAASRLARRTGCGVDEAAELLDGQLTRRAFLGVAGAGVLAGTAAAPRLAGSASSDPGKPRVVIVGSGIAGLGCAYRLWARHGIRPEVYEYNTVPGGRIRTLRGYFEDGQIVEEHAEFINPEHTATLALARSFGLRLDNTDNYRPGTHPGRETMRFQGKKWPQAALNRDWHDWAWKLFHHAANVTAPWPQLHNASSRG